MIHRTYICRLAPLLYGLPDLDIAVLTPGSRAAPVLNPILFPTVTAFTTPPTGWSAANGANWYYEVRGRPLRFEQFAGAAGFTPRTNLGWHLSIVALQDSNGDGDNGNLLPPLTLSASLAPAPAVSVDLAPGAAYHVALPDPGYGPVIRVWNSSEFVPGERGEWMLYQVDFRIAEIKDEDFCSSGHA